MSKNIRVRFAPSPTGYLHVGAIRTALFNWLFAKNQQGVFILRIEDTDKSRLVEDAADYIMDSLRWLGINWDEGPNSGGDFGPYIQSQRNDIYQRYTKQLLDSGRLYRDWTAPEELETMRKQAQKEKRAFKVDRSLLKTEGDINQPHVLRFAIDKNYSPSWTDIVRGELSQKADELDDFVCIKSDGIPTYNFANVIDDYEMQISHVIRGDEFVSSTPKFLQIYEALGWEPPSFAHVPPVLGADKAKLSKRHGALGALEYKELGYLPQAVINFLATLGWNDGTTQEIYDTDELIKSFSLERIQKSPAIFDEQRLDWLSGQHIRKLKQDQLYEHCESFWPKQAAGYSNEYKMKVLGLVHERLKYFSELPDLTVFFFEDPDIKAVTNTLASNKMTKKLKTEEINNINSTVLTKLQESAFDEEALENNLRKTAKELEIKDGLLFMIIRISVCGTNVAPGLFETLNTLGRETVLRRIANVL